MYLQEKKKYVEKDKINQETLKNYKNLKFNKKIFIKYAV